jgi:hypothetical protein
MSKINNAMIKQKVPGSDFHLFKPYRCKVCRIQISSTEYQYPSKVQQDKNYYKMQLCFNIDIEDKHFMYNNLKDGENKQKYVPGGKNSFHL